MRIVTLPLIALMTLAAVPAFAQRNGNYGNSQSPVVKPTAPPSAPTVQPPDAVPGAKPRADSVTPLKGGTTDLAPTEALFDSINRGDIVSARDAINRGADLDSTNLLGLTPIELSVDLGRNDISFLLLSLRGASGSSQAAVQSAAAAAAKPAAPPAPERRGRRAVQAAAAPAPRDSSPAPGRAPDLFAGNGGAPVPSAGFLGFDPHR